MRPRPHGANFAYDLSSVRMDSPVWNPVQCFEPSRDNFCSLRGAFHLGHVNFPLQTPERVSVGAEQNSVEVDAIAGHRTASSCLLSLGARGVCIPSLFRSTLGTHFGILGGAFDHDTPMDALR